MGQMTYAVIYGVDAGEAPETLEEGWYSLLEKYKSGNGPRPTTPSGDTENHDVVGFWVAVGASGKDDVPHLGMGFPLDGFLSVPGYKKSYERAKKAWNKFALWAEREGYREMFDNPKLWLVQTEVA